MSEAEIKITDKRMFTPDGELREGYEHLEEGGSGEAASGPAETRIGSESEDLSAEAERVEMPGTTPGMGTPTFMDLVAVLADPVALYLGDVQMPGGESVENLEMARLHIDLLDILREKTTGNVAPEESRVLEELLYQLRLRYVQKRG